MNNDAHIILFAEIQYCTIATRIRVGTRLGSLRHRRHIRPLQVTVESHLIVPLASGVKLAPPATATFYAEGTNKVCVYGEADINRDHTRLGHLLFPELRFRPTTRPRRKPLFHLKCPTHISTCSTHTNTCLTPPTRSYPALEHGGRCPFAEYSWHILKRTEDPGSHPGSCLGP